MENKLQAARLTLAMIAMTFLFVSCGGGGGGGTAPTVSDSSTPVLTWGSVSWGNAKWE